MKKIMSLGLAALLMLSCAACGAGNGSGKSQSDSTNTISMSQNELKLLYGRGTNLDVYDAEGEITWTNSNPEAVKLEESENSVMLTGIKAGGEATITAKTQKQGEVSCRVKVISAGLYLQDDRGYAGAYSSGTYNLGSQHVYSVFYDGNKISPSDVTWRSLDENIASVSNGTVVMAGEGTTYISATDKDGNTAYAFIWVSNTENEYETKIPGSGLFFEYMFTAYEEYILSNTENESMSFSIGDVYDDGVKIDAGTLKWHVEDLKGHPFKLAENETDAENVTIVYTQEAGQGFLVAENPATGHIFRYLIVAIDSKLQ